ncbi:hypothetical protein CGCSCA5_v014299 [Colletotrichum siamense]|uniref:uncharacterized protein n=1 Tax=Colletotrichum siamense TaxID=690259 RepID=UPI00187316DD|nr:uncharacterized protein CGCS363_v002484 [Colletotrichum siamense]KAF4806538.1 hypothetical protein CGCSCA5_v014299 [Colletotrichum siamense]KAF4869794.1 hypothetical protein CGCSCA1_v011034 [Colletotrichum siamense]KAF5511803.1 hypothetical protein CGCS363_v002484 [Colletotrichum siamense]
MKASALTLAAALFSAALSQELFRCRCADANSKNIAGITGLCATRGGVAEESRDDLCIKLTSKLTDEDCAKIQQGAKGDCIVDNLDEGTTLVTTVYASATATPTARPKL